MTISITDAQYSAYQHINIHYQHINIHYQHINIQLEFCKLRIQSPLSHWERVRAMDRKSLSFFMRFSYTLTPCPSPKGRGE